VKKGVTLIELAVVMAIIGIMALFMVPAIGQWIDSYRIKQAAREMVSDMQLAKMKAMGNSRYCTVTFNINVGGTDYSYIVYDDSDSDCEYDAGEEIYERMILGNEYKHVGFDTTQGGGDGLTFVDNDNNQPTVAFDARGLPRNNTGGFGAGTAFLKHSKNNKGRQVIVSAAGRVRIHEY